MHKKPSPCFSVCSWRWFLCDWLSWDLICPRGSACLCLQCRDWRLVPHYFCFVFKRSGWAAEMVQWLRAPTVLPKVLSSNPSNHMVAYNHLWWYLTPSSGASEDSYSVLRIISPLKKKKLWLTVFAVPGMVAHASNPSTREAEAGGFLSLRPSWSSEWVPGQPGLYRETLSQKT